MEFSNTFLSTAGLGIDLILLIVLLYLCKAVSRLSQTKPSEVKSESAAVSQAAPAAAAPQAAPAPVAVDHSALMAAVATAIAEYTGTSFSGFRIVSMRPVGMLETGAQSADLIAAITAALAEAEGEDFSDMRIASVTQI